MRLKSLTYTSFARPDLRPEDIAAIHHTALDLNALDGITGLLIYNGVGFLQIIEGGESAIDDLLRRLQADGRHHHLRVEDVRYIDQREFADWTMKLAVVSVSYFEARDDIAQQLPLQLPDAVFARVLEVCRGISQPS